MDTSSLTRKKRSLESDDDDDYIESTSNVDVDVGDDSTVIESFLLLSPSQSGRLPSAASLLDDNSISSGISHPILSSCIHSIASQSSTASTIAKVDASSSVNSDNNRDLKCRATMAAVNDMKSQLLSMGLLSAQDTTAPLAEYSVVPSTTASSTEVLDQNVIDSDLETLVSKVGSLNFESINEPDTGTDTDMMLRLKMQQFRSSFR